MNLTVLKNDELKEIIISTIEKNLENGPVIIGITGNIASGKTTLASKITKICKREFPTLSIGSISTDNFLYENKELKKNGLFGRKGFPESYDDNLIEDFIEAISEKRNITLPVYSHEINDIDFSKKILINNPDVLIIEGLLILREGLYNILDLSIFIDVNEYFNHQWFVQRCLNLGLDKGYDMNKDEFKELVENNWNNVNLKNYHENILPLKKKATIKIKMNFNHSIQSIVF